MSTPTRRRFAPPDGSETIDEFGMEPNQSKLEATVMPEWTPAPCQSCGSCRLPNERRRADGALALEGRQPQNHYSR